MILTSLVIPMALAVPADGAAQDIPPAVPTAAVANVARDGDIAIREEFERARALDTIAAWKLFLARHPDHPLAVPARARLAALAETDTDD